MKRLVALAIPLLFAVPLQAARITPDGGFMELLPASAEELGQPAHGQRMDRVLRNQGRAIQEIPPVGNPPITRWVYPDYTVYFQRRVVVDSVPHRGRSGEGE